MNKRQLKKQERALLTINRLPEGSYTFYIKKKHWNKGNKSSGAITVNNTDNFVSMDYLYSKRYKYFMKINNCLRLTVQIAKSPNNTNRIVKHW